MSITINEGAKYTGSTTVTLTLAAPSGGTQMTFSNDNLNWGSTLPFATSWPHILSSGDGLKTVYVKFLDGHGFLKGSDSSTITLDTTPPTAVSILINGGAADTSSRDVVLTLDATDTTSPVTEVRLQNEGGTFGAWQALTSSWTLSDGYGQKTVGVQFRDAAGNASGTVSASIDYIQHTVTGTWLILKTPDYDDATGTQTSYFRIGASDSTTENALLDSGTHPDSSSATKTSPGVQNADELRAGDPKKTYPGWFEYTDGDRAVVVRGQNRESVQGDETRAVGGNKFETIAGKYKLSLGAGTLEVWNADPVYHVEFYEQKNVFAAGKTTWRKREMGHNSSDTYTFGDTESFFGGYKFDAMFGMTNNVFIGGKIDLSMALSLSASIGFAVELGIGFKYSNVGGKDMKTAGNHEIKARKEIHLRIKKKHEGFGMQGNVTIPVPHFGDVDVSRNKVVAGIAVASGLGVAVLAGCSGAGTVDSSGVAAVPAGCLGGAAAAFALGLVGAVVVALMDKADDPVSQAEIKMKKKGIEILHNDDQGVMQSELYVGEAGGQPGFVKMKNNRNSVIQLDDDVLLRGGTDVYLMTHGDNARIKLLNNGDIRIKSTTAHIDGNMIQFGPNNELRIG